MTDHDWLTTTLSRALAEQGGTDLFTLADTLAELLQAPVTIEDHRSRVLAWSSGQLDVDDARTSTIVGRQVPRTVREHYRAQGVFRHLTRSDEPFVVPGWADSKARWVLPVRAGDEWLGSVWAVLEGDTAPARGEEARELVQVLALHLLRLRATSDLQRQLEVDQVRAVLQGGAAPEWWGTGTWQLAVLVGPSTPEGSALEAAARLEIWSALLARNGWPRPLLADLDGVLMALLDEGRSRWLGRIVRSEHQRAESMWVTTSNPVSSPAQLPEAVAATVEQARLGLTVLGAPITGPDDCWAQVLLARATATSGRPLGSPVRTLANRGHHTGAVPGEATGLVETLHAALRHWGDPRAAAAELGVHPNTVRNRMARLTSLVALDLSDPDQRLAAWLECERLLSRRAHQATE